MALDEKPDTDSGVQRQRESIQLEKAYQVKEGRLDVQQLNQLEKLVKQVLAKNQDMLPAMPFRIQYQPG